MLKVALIGFGRMGQMHYELMSNMACYEIKYIVDDAPVSKTLHCQAERVSSTELDKILADTDIDAVIIAASTAVHVALIEKAIQFKKAVFCEKPVSLSLDVLNALKAKIDDHQVKFQVGLNRRFDPDFLNLKQQLANQVIGRPYIIKITNRDPQRPDLSFVKDSGGLFYDFNVHDFDMVHFLTGKSVVETQVMGDALIDPQLKAFNDIDTAIISKKLNDGTLVVIDSSRETSYGYDQRIEVHGEKGMLQVDNLLENTVQSITSQGTAHATVHWSFVERYQKAYENELLHFHDYVLADEALPSPAGIDDMMAAVEVAQKVENAYRSGDLLSFL